MSIKKNYLGKVVKDVNGYKVRPMGSGKSFSKPNGVSNTYFQPNGKFGVFAGRKKLVKGDFTSAAEAIAYASTL
jgi:hypothetical protein